MHAADADIMAFVRGGVAVIAATRDDAMRPEITRGWGPALSPDGCELQICLSAAPESKTLANLSSNGDLAATFSLPTTYRSVQIKGTAHQVREPTDAELARAEEHLASFVDQVARVGLPPALGTLIAVRPFVAVTIAIRELYDQTPGARAGTAL